MTSKKNIRPIRIKLSLDNVALRQRIKRSLDADCVRFVTSVAEADLVVLDDLDVQKNDVNNGATYVYLFGHKGCAAPLALPLNALAVHVDDAVKRLAAMVSDLVKKTQPIDDRQGYARVTDR